MPRKKNIEDRKKISNTHIFVIHEGEINNRIRLIYKTIKKLYRNKRRHEPIYWKGLHVLEKLTQNGQLRHILIKLIIYIISLIVNSL